MMEVHRGWTPESSSFWGLNMNNFLVLLGRSAGLVGLILCLVSGFSRLAGMHWFGGFETVTVLLAGIGGMVFGCFCLLFALTPYGGKH